MDKKVRKRHLSQFFTPEVVVDFMFDFVDFEPHWKVIDPACGDGVFMKEALRRGGCAVVGIDIDPDVVGETRENLKDYQGKFHVFNQDGLKEIETDNGYLKGQYDLVIGNPPFSSSKYRVTDRDILKNYDLARIEDKDNSMVLPGLEGEITPYKSRPSQVIEVLFLERFVQFAKPDGMIAIILPEGVLANRSLKYVREWIILEHIVHAIVSLPGETFKNTGTTAKTNILFIEKRKIPSYQVLLCTVSRLNMDGKEDPQLKTILDVYRERRHQDIPGRVSKSSAV